MPGTPRPTLSFRTTWPSLSPGLVHGAGGGLPQRVAPCWPAAGFADSGSRSQSASLERQGAKVTRFRHGLAWKACRAPAEKPMGVLSQTGPDPRHSFSVRLPSGLASGCGRRRGGRIAMPESPVRQRSILIQSSCSCSAELQCSGTKGRPPHQPDVPCPRFQPEPRLRWTGTDCGPPLQRDRPCPSGKQRPAPTGVQADFRQRHDAVRRSSTKGSDQSRVVKLTTFLDQFNDMIHRRHVQGLADQPVHPGRDASGPIVLSVMRRQGNDGDLGKML